MDCQQHMQPMPTPSVNKPPQTDRRITLRVCWPADLPPPEPGTWLWSAGARVAYRIARVTVIHHATNNPRPRLCFQAVAVPAKALPEGITPLPWDLTVFRRPAHLDAQRAARQEAEAKRTEMVNPPKAARVKPLKPARDPGPMPAYRALADGPGAAQEARWTDPDDLGRYGKHARQVKGYRSRCTLRAMRSAGSTGITDQHIIAADLMRLTYDIGRLGRSADRELLQEVGGGAKGPMSGPPEIAAEQTRCEREYKRLLRFLRPLKPDVLLAVVLGNRTIASWCREQTERTGEAHNKQVEMGKLVTMLDALADFFASNIKTELFAGYPVE